MSLDPRAALAAFVAALETHLEMAADRRGDDDPHVVAAYQRIADAFVAYDDALLETYGEVTPLDIYSDDDDDDEDDDDDDDFDEGDDEDDDEDDLDIVDLDDEDDDQDVSR
jgi:hypothetical protein